MATLLREGFKGRDPDAEGEIVKWWTPLRWYEILYLVYVGAFLVGWVLRATGLWPVEP